MENCYNLHLASMDAISRLCRGSRSEIQEAFHEACRKGYGYLAAPLIEAGADVNATVDRDRTPLELALFTRSPDLVEVLINAGADVNAYVGHFTSHLHIAADNPHNEAEKYVNLLIEAGADVNMTKYGSNTALMTAAWRGTSTNVIRALINAGADVNARDSYGRCAISCATERNFVEGLELLIEAADKVDPTRSYLPPLSDIEFGLRGITASTLKLLLRIGFKINVPNPHYNNTLTYYIVQCKRECDRLSKYICMLLFAAGERVRGRIVEGTTHYHGILRAEVPEYLFHKDLRLYLKHLCREAIRKCLLDVDPHEHLFFRVTKLGLPMLLADYLVYEMTLDDQISTDWCKCSRSHEAAHWCRMCHKS